MFVMFVTVFVLSVITSAYPNDVLANAFNVTPWYFYTVLTAEKGKRASARYNKVEYLTAPAVYLHIGRISEFAPVLHTNYFLLK